MKGVRPHRRVKVLINPKGGPGKAKQAFEKRVKPIFDAAKCLLDVQYTTKRFHAQEIAASMSLDYDAIASLSGDGLPHEIINGIASRTDDSVHALRTVPVVPIPTGSANGFNLNLQGMKGCFDVGLAALNVIKGKPMHLDMCSVTQGTKRSWSFFTQAAGLMSDLDVGTEHLRWMGDSRFIYGYLRGLIAKKPCPIKVSMKVVESDKQKLLERIREHKMGTRPVDVEQPTEDPPSLSLSSLPEDKYANESPDGGHSDWVVFDKPILYLYSGTQPYVARDLLQFPAARPADGLLDVVIQEVTDRASLLGALNGAEYGHAFFMKTQHYFKVKALRVEPISSSKKSLFSIDGEKFPWEPLYIEPHKALFTTLSLHGDFIQDFRETTFQK
ncbi:ATP-NAD kinase-like domain-containing protein [Cantharellus anzutake]|uniref:ATP-NAD kinase-like domain-containing protein n=1 Tax=Cantharellus anzutake TaxID=1750568 RepID=UPI001908098D|nr:ATP-NAD kinase-like domain-containing protein [Cantharellus anzutake]KAF8334184.1 ATP-NAD kinase-like domain-containing protein [Cantharellus anzutake]